jgi:hypothetical protein
MLKNITACALLALLVAAPRIAAADDASASPVSPDKADAKPGAEGRGVVGTISFLRPIQLGSSGSESERNCGTVGTQCSADPASGGGFMFSVGYMWKYVGFDLLAGGTVEGGERRFVAGSNGQQSYTVEKLGGLAALRFRGSIQSENFRGTLALGPGIAFRAVGQSDAFPGIPKDGGTYRSLAFTADVNGQWRVGKTTSLVLGTMLWVEDAGNDVTTFRSAGNFHLVSGTQTTVMPYLGFQFGP